MSLSIEDEINNHNKFQTFSHFLLLFCSIVVLNLFILNIVIFKEFSAKTTTNLYSNYAVNQATVLGTSNTTACPQSCISKINDALNSKTNSSSSLASLPKEYFIPLGSGTGLSDEWADVAGLQVEINTANYPKIKSAYFESSVYVPGANQIVYVRLYNVTEDHPVWNSELSFNNAGSAQTQSSPSIILGSGNKAYKVQLKTQLKFSTNISAARIRIITQ